MYFYIFQNCIVSAKKALQHFMFIELKRRQEYEYKSTMRRPCINKHNI